MNLVMLLVMLHASMNNRPHVCSNDTVKQGRNSKMSNIRTFNTKRLGLISKKKKELGRVFESTSSTHLRNENGIEDNKAYESRSFFFRLPTTPRVFKENAQMVWNVRKKKWPK